MFRGVQPLVALVACFAVTGMIGCKATAPAISNAVKGQDTGAPLHASGTIVSVEERAHDEQSDDLLPGPQVCFTIDSFAEIPYAERAAYESAERTRIANQGPRCRDTAVDLSALHLRAGDHIDVYFQLEDRGQISLVRVSAHGVDL